MQARIELQSICKHYRSGNGRLSVLKDASFSVEPGEFVAICGPSGAGKSTLLNIIGCLDRWDSGSYRLGDVLVNSLSDDRLADIRRHHIGFVFQFYNLIPRLDALRNVELPLVYQQVSGEQRREMAYRALEQVGLTTRAGASPAQLSGGEQQRVAIARALIKQSQIILMDEPTGNLDSGASKQIMDIIERLNSEGKTIIAVTHEAAVARYAKRVYDLRDGVLRIESEQ